MRIINRLLIKPLLVRIFYMHFMLKYDSRRVLFHVNIYLHLSIFAYLMKKMYGLLSDFPCEGYCSV